MAGEMSDIGSGISLQGKPSRGFESILARRLAADTLGKRQKKQQDWEKYVDGIKLNPDKVHRIDYANAQQDVAKFISNASGLIQKYGDSWENTPEAAELKTQTKLAMGQYEERKYNLDNISKGISELQKTQSTHPEQDAVLSALNSGNYQTLNDIGKKYSQYGVVNVGQDQGGRSEVAVDLSPKTNFSKLYGDINKPEFTVDDPDRPTEMGKTFTLGNKTISHLITPKVIADPVLSRVNDSVLGDANALRDYKRYLRPNVNSSLLDDASFTEAPQGLTDSQRQTFDQNKLQSQKMEMLRVARSLTSSKSSEPIVSETPPQPTESDKKKQWKVEGNTYKDGNNVWHYDRDAKGDETFTFSKVNPADNAVMIFDNGVKGIPVRFEKAKDSASPNLIIETQQKVPLTKEKNGKTVPQLDANGNPKTETITKEIPLAYSDYNAAKIENEFGKNPYTVRSAVTGSTSSTGGRTTGAAKEQTKVSSRKSEGSSEKAYTRAELKALSPSYTDEVIEAAVKSGRIKLK